MTNIQYRKWKIKSKNNNKLTRVLVSAKPIQSLNVILLQITQSGIHYRCTLTSTRNGLHVGHFRFNWSLVVMPFSYRRTYTDWLLKKSISATQLLNLYCKWMDSGLYRRRNVCRRRSGGRVCLPTARTRQSNTTYTIWYKLVNIFLINTRVIFR